MNFLYEFENVDMVVDPQLKRKRVADWDDSDSDWSEVAFSKRKRELTPQQQLDITSLSQRVIKWVVTHPDQLPKNLSSLQHAIYSLCTSIVTISEEVIFYQLLFNGVLEISLLPSGEKVIRSNPNPKPFENFVGYFVGGDSDSAVQFSDDFCYALRRARDWIATNQGLIVNETPLASFLKSLKQICQFKRPVPPSAVIASLVKRGLIEISPIQTISYDLALFSAAYNKLKYT
jgi:hypothetical protein